MKRLYRKIAALGSAFVMATVPFSLEACTKEKEPSPEPEQPPIVQPVETEQEKAEKLYYDLVDSMKGGNFTLENGSKTYKFAKDKAEIDGGFYFSDKGRDVYIADGVKDFTDLSVASAKNEVIEQFDGAEFDGYSNGALSGTLPNGDEISVKVSSNKIEMTVNGETWTVSDINNTNVNQQECTQDKTAGEQPVEKTLQEAAAEINAFLNEVKQSQKFTYTKTENSNVKKYSFLDGLMKVEKDGAVKIYEEEGENKYVYSQQNGAWNKDFTDKSIADALESFDTFVTNIKNASWESFEANQLSGTYDGKNVTAKLNGDTLEMDVDDKTVTISENVESFAKPAQVTDNTIQSEKLWENVAGQRVYNYKLLAQTLEDWIKENDGYLNEITTGGNTNLNKILYLEPGDDSFIFAALIDDNLVQRFKIKTNYIGEAFADNNNSTTKFKQFLTSQKNQYPILRTFGTDFIRTEYNSYNATPEQKTEMEGLTTSVFNKLATEGWKENSWKGDGTKVTDLEDAKVLFSGKGEITDRGDAYDLGKQSTWRQYYLIENNGNLEWVDVLVSSAGTQNESIERVIDGSSNLWFVHEPKRDPIDKGSSQLYDNVLKTSAKSLNL